MSTERYPDNGETSSAKNQPHSSSEMWGAVERAVQVVAVGVLVSIVAAVYKHRSPEPTIDTVPPVITGEDGLRAAPRGTDALREFRKMEAQKNPPDFRVPPHLQFAHQHR